MKRIDELATQVYKLDKRFGIKITVESGFRNRWVSAAQVLPEGPGPFKKFNPFGYFLYIN